MDEDVVVAAPAPAAQVEEQASPPPVEEPSIGAAPAAPAAETESSEYAAAAQSSMQVGAPPSSEQESPRPFLDGLSSSEAPPPPSDENLQGAGMMPPPETPDEQYDGYDDQGGPPPDEGGGGWNNSNPNDGSLGEEESALVADFASHPMMDRVQKVLIETLQRELERTTLAAREKQEAALRESRTREDVGVELYGAQQQLARLQLQLEKQHNEAVDLADVRAKEQLEAANSKKAHASLAGALAERSKHLLKSQTELDAISETLRQVDKYNEEMRKEIAVSKRATYKAEENVQHLEKAKQRQDVYIDSLEQRARSLGESIAVHETQLERQKEESAEARAMLAETAQEMSLIVFEKKQLIQQWKASLVQLARRDEALAAATTTLEQARREIRDLSAELEGTKRDCLLAANEGFALKGVLEKHAKDEANIEVQLDKVREESSAVEAQYSLLQRSMKHTEQQERVLLTENKEATEQLAQLEAHVQTVTGERHKVEQKIFAERSASSTVTKAVRSIRQETAKVMKKTNELEMEQAHLENEVARVRVDALNTEAHNEQLRSTLEEAVDKLKTQDELVAKYQLEIRQRNDDIEKKMYRVDRLNRKYEKMTENMDEGEALGPLEATIKNLQKEQASMQQDVVKLQAKWLSDQTALVTVSQETEVTLLEQTSELKAKERILSERRLQLLKDEESHTTQVAALEANVKAMRGDVARLNELLGKYSDKEKNIANDTAIMEMEFHAELGELEQEALTQERKVEAIKERKQLLLDEIVETERQVMLWEKKIQIERETQEALDPEVGSSEVSAMETEIHRMKLRQDGLLREQERMMAEMERGILKREATTLRFQKTASGGKPTTETKAAVKKQCSKLRAAIAKTAREAQDVSNAIQKRQRDLQDSTAGLAEATTLYGNLEAQAQKLQAAINTLLYEKQRRAELQASKERTAQRYLDLERGSSTAPLPDDSAEAALATDRKLAAAQDELRQVRNLITSLRSHFDYLAEPLDRIMRLTDDAETGVIPKHQPEDLSSIEAAGQEDDPPNSPPPYDDDSSIH